MEKLIKSTKNSKSVKKSEPLPDSMDIHSLSTNVSPLVSHEDSTATDVMPTQTTAATKVTPTQTTPATKVTPTQTTPATKVTPTQTTPTHKVTPTQTTPATKVTLTQTTQATKVTLTQTTQVTPTQTSATTKRTSPKSVQFAEDTRVITANKSSQTKITMKHIHAKAECHKSKQTKNKEHGTPRPSRARDIEAGPSTHLQPPRVKTSPMAKVVTDAKIVGGCRPKIRERQAVRHGSSTTEYRRPRPIVELRSHFDVIRESREEQETPPQTLGQDLQLRLLEFNQQSRQEEYEIGLESAMIQLAREERRHPLTTTKRRYKMKDIAKCLAEFLINYEKSIRTAPFKWHHPLCEGESEKEFHKIRMPLPILELPSSLRGAGDEVDDSALEDIPESDEDDDRDKETALLLLTSYNHADRILELEQMKLLMKTCIGEPSLDDAIGHHSKCLNSRLKEDYLDYKEKCLEQVESIKEMLRLALIIIKRENFSSESEIEIEDKTESEIVAIIRSESTEEESEKEKDDSKTTSDDISTDSIGDFRSLDSGCASMVTANLFRPMKSEDPQTSGFSPSNERTSNLVVNPPSLETDSASSLPGLKLDSSSKGVLDGSEDLEESKPVKKSPGPLGAQFALHTKTELFAKFFW